nr:integrase, catalytic region, zinc finger, CCHC-type, peptidase aspartic, catalytic [Tanacetum cinerariifolium]
MVLRPHSSEVRFITTCSCSNDKYILGIKIQESRKLKHKDKVFRKLCLNAKTLNVKSVCATCDTYVLIDKHDMCVLKSVAKPRNLKLLINFVEKFLGTVKFRNDQIAPILGYGDLVQGAFTIKRVYYVEGLNHNLFSVGQFCDAGLEVAFRKSTCYIRVIPTTSVSRPQLKSNPQGDRVMHNNSRGKKQEIEDQCRNVKFSKNKTFVTACNDSLNAKTLNVKSVCATCNTCMLIDKHDMCVLKSVTKPSKETVTSESDKKPRNFTRKLYERVSKTCSWWYPMFTPLGYKWKPKSGKENVNPNLVEIVLFIVDSGCSKHMTGNLKLVINFVEKFLGTVKFGNDQIAPILGYGDLVQGAVTIKRVYYIEGLSHNLFFVGQFCDTDLEVAFRKSTCYIRDLKGNDLLTGSRGTDLYSIKLQNTNCPNPICLMAKATSSQAWLWHRRLSHLNFDTINLLSKNDIVVGLPKLKFVKDHLCSSCELGKSKR